MKSCFDEHSIEAGIDEAGRGCLCGRVYAAAVIVPKVFDDDIYLQIKDSKKMSIYFSSKFSSNTNVPLIRYSEFIGNLSLK